MSTTVSRSAGSDRRIPSRQERDDAFSAGAGRKAVEELKEQGNSKKSKKTQAIHQSPKQERINAPVGLDNETKAQANV